MEGKVVVCREIMSLVPSETVPSSDNKLVTWVASDTEGRVTARWEVFSCGGALEAASPVAVVSLDGEAVME